MKESILKVGPRQLVGILCKPDTIDPRQPPVLFPNTGLEHRVGPNRVHVVLARALARAGIPSLRLDLSGMGDSPSSVYPDSIADLKSAIDTLQAHGFGRQVIGVGLCSGAHDLHQLARVDGRLIAMVSIDGYSYPTTKFHFHYLLQRLAEPGRLVRRLRKAFRRSSTLDDAGLEGSDIHYCEQPSYQQMRADLRRFIGRKCALWYIYTGQIQNVYNYRNQFYDRFPELRGEPLLQLSYLVQADHTFSRVDMREGVAAALIEWIVKGVQGGFPALDPSPSASPETSPNIVRRVG